MEKTEGKIRYGLIGIGAQGGSYARFLTNAPAPFPGMVCAPCPDNCALGALCDIDPEKEKMQGAVPRCALLQGLEGYDRQRHC